MSECSAVVRTPRDGLSDQVQCRNGFPITGSCLGTAGTPMCCREEWCGRTYQAKGGKPAPLDQRKETACEPPEMDDRTTRAEIARKRQEALRLRRQADEIERDANELERHLDLSRTMFRR